MSKLSKFPWEVDKTIEPKKPVERTPMPTDKETLENRIVQAVEEYFKTHKAGIRMSILSCRFLRVANQLGGFPEFMQELADKNRIRIEVTKTGGRLVYPGQSQDLSIRASKYF